MKKITTILFLATIALSSCLKELSNEGDDGSAGIIVGADCRINKLAFADSATGKGLASVSATINASDEVTSITGFDSLTLTIDYNSTPQYFANGDTVYIDPAQYFVRTTGSKRVRLFHGLIDPTLPASPGYDVNYVYDANGKLAQKLYNFSSLQGITYQEVTYTYSGGNLVSMKNVDAFTGDIISDASLTYHGNIAPKNFIYLFPDEVTLMPVHQFFNFGNRNLNAVKTMKVRYYDPGNVVTDSTVSDFKGYVLSRDNYVLSTYMVGDDQISIPAGEGKLSFEYKCK
jgi:hypothetical protein